jgi:hypothetical protein
MPSSDATRPVQPLAVLASIPWHSGEPTEVEALAVAWTAQEVEVEWTTPWGALRRDWIAAAYVRRLSSS